MDKSGVLNRCIDSSGNLVTTVVAGTPDAATAPGARRDENWVWSQVFDETTNAIRVVNV